MDEGDRPKDPEVPHQERVQKTFDALHQDLGGKLNDDARATVERLREAAAERDAERVRAHLDRVKESDSWLYRELTAHPDFAALIDELALWGF
jgi:hypothetical protein